MDKRLIPVAMLAGALALAGCGGGSDTPAASSTNPGTTNPGTTTTTTSALKEVPLPAGSNFEVTSSTALQGTIPAGGSRDFGNVKITCDGTVACSYQIREGKIFANNGADPSIIPPKKTPKEETEETVDADDTAPAAPVSRDKTGAPAGGTAWLSADALIKAVKENDQGFAYVEIQTPNAGPLKGRTVDSNGNLAEVIEPHDQAGGDFKGNDGAGVVDADEGGIVHSTGVVATNPKSGSVINHFVVDTNDGYETDLRLIHTRDRKVTNDQGVEVDDDRLSNDYLVFGTWERRTSANPGPHEQRVLGYEYNGSIERTDVAAWETGDATYEGKALGHYNHAGSGWKEWDGTVHLEANFAQGNISGAIKTGIADGDLSLVTGDKGLGTVSLKSTDIAARSNGTATIPDRASDRVGAASTGTWEAEYYGSVIHGSPTGVAGEFASKRPQVTSTNGVVITTHQTAAEVRGAFGGHRVSQLQETDVD